MTGMILSLKRHLLSLLGTIALVAGPTYAADTRDFDIPPQELASALKSLAQQTGLELIFQPGDLKGIQTQGVKGNLSPQDAVVKLIAGTDLTIKTDAAGAILITADRDSDSNRPIAATAVVSDVKLVQADSNASQQAQVSELGTAGTKKEEEDPERSGIPEILITGSKIGSLNTDIERSRDDIQPYVVFSREALERSGSVNVEDFLKGHLPMSTNGSVTAQGANTIGNISRINLRGLGSDETLILIDGRRTAGPNLGAASQADLNAIPLSAIERVEVLPTTAAGIYGGGATGGVINVVLRRDYIGINTKITYNNTFESDVAQRRFDISGRFNLEGGRTNMLFFGNYSDSNPLLAEERHFVRRGREHILANDPSFFYKSIFPPLGSTPNIQSSTGEDLILKDGTRLNSPITYVPHGYAGVAADGGKALVANAGQYNLDLPNTAQSSGGRQALLSTPTVKSLMFSVRREFSRRLQAFLQVDGSDNSGIFSRNPLSVFPVIPQSAPHNPFQQAILVSVPTIGADSEVSTEYKTQSATAGAIMRLSANWHAEADFKWNRTRLSYRTGSEPIRDIRAELNGGSLDVLRDLAEYPVDFGPYSALAGVSPADVVLRNTTLRLAGPLPWSAPAGDIIISTLIEHRDEDFGAFLFSDKFGPNSTIPDRAQNINSVYLETKVPLVSARNSVPGIRALELQLAARRDAYELVGSQDAAPVDSNEPVLRFRNRRSSTDPTIGVRYEPLKDVIFRASYGTGYLPPGLNQLVPNSPFSLLFGSFGLVDPLRGGESLGEIEYTSGGNSTLRPEQSRSYSAGLILTPRNVPGVRLSIDWTEIEKVDNIVHPYPFSQDGLEELIAAAPNRILRAPPSDGFSVGPITAIDGTYVNIANLRVEAVDFALDYRIENSKFGGFELSAGATRLLQLDTRASSDSPVVDNLGVASSFGGEGGGLKWKGVGSITWHTRDWQVGWTTRYFDSYYLNSEHSIVPWQGSATIPSQTYHDLFIGYQRSVQTDSAVYLLSNLQIQFGINNIFNKSPPVDVNAGLNEQLYSQWGDPRLANYYLSVNKTFGGH